MQLTKRQENKLDKQIEASYYKNAQGRQIDIMKIGALFRDAKKDHLNGMTLDEAVLKAIETHCVPKGDENA